MSVLMICEGLALDGSGPVGQFLESYDPEAFGGRGYVRWTADITKAKRFDDPIAAFVEWKRAPACHPVRMTDGRPNRPLTAYTISVRTID